ncbi:MAG TPA: flagellar basal body rod protein [Methylibium sp.]|nr:flagellar basal body rod protein [Methylibium sp.]
MSTAAIALSGLAAARRGLQVSAHNLANLQTAGFRRQRLDHAASADGGVETSVSRAAMPGAALAEDVVAQLRAKNFFLANLAVFKASDRMTGALLDRWA